MTIRGWKRHFGGRRFAFLGMIVFVVLAVNSAIAGRQRRYPVPETLAPIPTPIGVSGRRLFRFGEDECVVIRPPVELVGEVERQQYLGADEETDLVRQVLSPGNRWHTDPSRPEEQTTFNCASFAIGDVIGLSRADFINPRAVAFTNMQNPARVLLQEYFYRLETYPLAAVEWDELDTLESLGDDDVVVFATHGKDDEYVHLGKIAKVHGRNRMVSKMGRGPIVRGTIQRTAQEYEGRFDEIQIYRRR
ncbi:hypothetical protein FYK55_04560 [Roseiconus nitratireducens]|uniref:Uncharacterized protein n=1 Tax=Roseiconus nitratireducens TaxID=2605748 RepID=A0A5M6DIV7_9BACT|nr:hypothetical protein [Roseiconus nitratireducens]KAA5546172.1 hypothetical protein FYK55_04560 [Roseiconus nitratireducens]